MDIQEIKATLGVSKLELSVAENKAGEKTDWLRHWDNVKRVAVSIHKELFDEIKKDPSAITNLSLQSGKRTGEKGEYVTQRIIRYTPAEFEL